MDELSIEPPTMHTHGQPLLLYLPPDLVEQDGQNDEAPAAATEASKRQLVQSCALGEMAQALAKGRGRG